MKGNVNDARLRNENSVGILSPESLLSQSIVNILDSILPSGSLA